MIALSNCFSTGTMNNLEKEKELVTQHIPSFFPPTNHIAMLK